LLVTRCAGAAQRLTEGEVDREFVAQGQPVEQREQLVENSPGSGQTRLRSSMTNVG
jgi:hypothetical protein